MILSSNNTSLYTILVSCLYSYRNSLLFKPSSLVILRLGHEIFLNLLHSSPIPLIRIQNSHIVLHLVLLQHLFRF